MDNMIHTASKSMEVPQDSVGGNYTADIDMKLFNDMLIGIAEVARLDKTSGHKPENVVIEEAAEFIDAAMKHGRHYADGTPKASMEDVISECMDIVAAGLVCLRYYDIDPNYILKFIIKKCTRADERAKEGEY